MGTSVIMQAFLIFFYILYLFIIIIIAHVALYISLSACVCWYMYSTCYNGIHVLHVHCEVILLVLYCLLVSVNFVYLFTISPVIITCFCVS